MKSLYILLITTISLSIVQAQQDYVDIQDFEILNNTQWKGQLTYRDYQSGKWTPIDAAMQIIIKGHSIKTAIQYTYEPSKNNKSTVRLKKEGRFFGNERVISNTVLDGFRIIKTCFEGKDDNKKAMIFITHKFNKNNYSITKEVQYANTTERIIRNKYQFNKI